MFPRLGGIWDQDPELIHDFRIIRGFEVQWKEDQDRINEAQSGGTGGGLGIEDALNNYLEELGEDGTF